MEAFASFLGVLFTPYLSARLLNLEIPTALDITLLIKRYSIFFLIIFFITVIMNIPRARRYCLDRQTGESKSWGIANGWKKGLLTATLTVFILFLLTRVFPLVTLIINLVSTFFSESAYVAAEGIILSIFYMIFYSAIAYPIWGSC